MNDSQETFGIQRILAVLIAFSKNMKFRNQLKIVFCTKEQGQQGTLIIVDLKKSATLAFTAEVCASAFDFVQGQTILKL